MTTWNQLAVEALQACPLAMVALDREGKVRLWNPAAENLFGWAGQEILGEPCPLQIRKAENRFVSLRDQVLTEGAGGTEAVMRGKEGNLLEVHVAKAMIRDAQEEMVGSLHVFEGIATRKEREAERNYLAAIVQSANNAIYSWDLNRVILSWNRGAELTYGFTAQEAIGQAMDLIVPPDLKLQYLSFVQRVQRGERIGNLQTERLHKNGTRIWISLTLSPVVDDAGRIIAASAIAHDITKWKFFQAMVEKVQREKLEGIIPICAACKKIRDEVGAWSPIESYIRKRAEVEFSHGICPDCQSRLYPEHQTGNAG